MAHWNTFTEGLIQYMIGWTIDASKLVNWALALAGIVVEDKWSVTVNLLAHWHALASSFIKHLIVSAHDVMDWAFTFAGVRVELSWCSTALDCFLGAFALAVVGVEYLVGQGAHLRHVGAYTLACVGVHLLSWGTIGGVGALTGTCVLVENLSS